MKDLVLAIARSLADHPAAIAVTELRGRQTSLVELRCHPQDRGRLIGRNGRVVGAIRTVVEAIGVRQGRRAVFEVVEG